jgi:hypothetical protein
VPDYYPHVAGGSQDWTQLHQLGPDDLVILNMDRGPIGRTDWSNQHYYEPMMQVKERTRARFLGYIPTEFGLRSPRLVIAIALDWYRDWIVDGFFIDETASSDRAGYYKSLQRTLGWLWPDSKRAYNMAAYPQDKAQMDNLPLVVTFEGSADSYERQYAMPDWMATRWPNKTAHLIHSAPSGDYSRLVGLAKTRRAGYVYVTTRRPEEDAWGGLPDEFDRLVAAVRSL